MITADLIPSHEVAQWLLSHIHRILDHIGLKKDVLTEEIIYAAIIVGGALLIGWIVSNLVRIGVKKFLCVRNPQLGHELVGRHVLVHCCRVIPPLVILAFLPFAFTGKSLINIIVLRGLLIYTTIVLCMAICSVTSFIWLRFDEKRNTKNLPIKGILDTIVSVLWIVTVIICVAIIVDKSPVKLLTGLGAFAAVLMLVFKDSILGLVAGLQLSQNDELRVGDWIVVPSTIANGIVIDVSLTSVKIQNWDNTIVTVPPYSLISGSFQNWRGMQDSGCRQIARAVRFEVYSVKSVDDKWIDSMVEKLPSLKPFVEKIRANGGKPDYDPGLATTNGTLDTNLGLFRAYMCQWLIDNPYISNDSQILVRVMVPDEYGVPLQIWCFTATTKWTEYEAIQSALFEHVIVTAPLFGLNIYNESSGSDSLTVNLADQTPALHDTITHQSGQESAQQGQR
ncbi:MAG: mechanosensitive ion channel [Duncaniella sp.]|nr:mechanosensitive ion channel [Duncaniella sp.]